MKPKPCSTLIRGIWKNRLCTRTYEYNEYKAKQTFKTDIKFFYSIVYQYIYISIYVVRYPSEHFDEFIVFSLQPFSMKWLNKRIYC